MDYSAFALAPAIMRRYCYNAQSGASQPHPRSFTGRAELIVLAMAVASMGFFDILNLFSDVLKS